MSDTQNENKAVVEIPELDDTPAVAEVSVTEVATQVDVEVPQAPVIEAEEAVVENTAEVQREDRPWMHHRVQLPADVLRPGKVEGSETLSLPSTFQHELNESIQGAPETDLTDSENARLWAEHVRVGQELLTMGERFTSTLSRDGEVFTNRPDFNGIPLAGGYPKFKASGPENIMGERAVMRFMAYLELGNNHQTPLVHSGIWLTFKPPGEDELIELNRQIIADKIQLGRYTYGMAFSNVTGIMTERVAQFGLRHIYDISTRLEDIPLNNLLDHISILDFPAFLQGLCAAQYPNGFNYETACVHDPEKCNHVDSGIINIDKTLVMSLASLTDWQRNFWSQRQSKRQTLADVKRYRDEFKLTQRRRHTLKTQSGKNLHITLKVPSIGDTIRATHSWIDSIDEVVTKAVGETVDRQQRIGLINSYGQASIMRQYTQWVESLEYGDEGDEGKTPVVQDVETIEKLLNRLSGDDQIRKSFTELVKAFIDEATCSVVGIPAYTCPSCGGEHKHSNPESNFKSILPIDMLQVFFVLLTRRLSRISLR